MRKFITARLSICVGGACLGVGRPLGWPIKTQPVAALLLLVPSTATGSRGASRCPSFASNVKRLIKISLLCMTPALARCGWNASNITDYITM